MNIVEIVSGVLLLISSLFIILVTLLQESKEQGMNSAIGGGSSDSFYGKNSGRSREAKLVRITTVMAIIFFVATLAVNILPIIFK